MYVDFQVILAVRCSFEPNMIEFDEIVPARAYLGSTGIWNLNHFGLRLNYIWTHETILNQFWFFLFYLIFELSLTFYITQFPPPFPTSPFLVFFSNISSFDTLNNFFLNFQSMQD